MTKLLLSSCANGQQNRNFVASGSGSGWPHLCGQDERNKIKILLRSW